MAAVAEVSQGGHARLGDEDHVAAIATVATVGAPARHVRLAAE
jgi:hypothetical protein